MTKPSENTGQVVMFLHYVPCICGKRFSVDLRERDPRAQEVGMLAYSGACGCGRPADLFISVDVQGLVELGGDS